MPVKRSPREFGRSGWAASYRDPQHLHLLLGCLRYSDLQQWRTAPRTPAPTSTTIEGDPDHPVNRGRCVQRARPCSISCTGRPRLKAPRYRPPAASEFKEVTWDFVLDRIARLMRTTRQELHRKDKAGTRSSHGQYGHAGGVALPPARPPMRPGRSCAPMGWWCFDNPGACLTRTDGGQSGPTFGRGALTNPGRTSERNVVVVMGGNAAEAHPCGLDWPPSVRVRHAPGCRTPPFPWSARPSRSHRRSRWRKRTPPACPY